MQANDRKRARSEDEKFQRRQQILAAAESHFRDVGFEAFSTAKLARLAGVAKGTLYLYFTTREEVLLSLYCQQLERFAGELGNRLESGMTDDAFIRAFHDSAMADPAFVALSVRLSHVIENNVSIEALVTSKRVMRTIIEGMSTRIASALDIGEAQAFDLISSLASQLIGTARHDAGPEFDAEELPEDVRSFIDAFHTEESFLTNARRILAGIRADI